MQNEQRRPEGAADVAAWMERREGVATDEHPAA